MVEENKGFDADFDKVGSGASTTYPLPVGELKKGGHCVISGRPCKIMEITTSKTGKHGHAKAKIVGVCIFSEKKAEDVQPVSHNKDVPFITRTEYTIITLLDDNYISLMDSKGKTRDDLKLPSETEYDKTIAERIKKGIDDGKVMVCTVLAAMDIEKIEDAKEAQN